MLHCDAKNGFAEIEAAKTFGLTGVTVQRAHHIAALWPEVETLAEAALVGIKCCQTIMGPDPKPPSGVFKHECNVTWGSSVSALESAL